MPFKMYFSLMVIFFTVIESLDSICHKQCVCLKRVGLLQCTDLDSADYSSFRGSMTWIKAAVFTTSVVDTKLLIQYAPNLKGIKLHNCVIVSCNLNGCPEANLPAEQSSTQITNNEDIDIPSKDVKTANSKSDITLKVTTAVFDGYLSVMHKQSTSSSLKASGYLYFLLLGIISIVLTLVIAATCYILYKYCCKKKVCRKWKTVPKKRIMMLDQKVRLFSIRMTILD